MRLVEGIGISEAPVAKSESMYLFSYSRETLSVRINASSTRLGISG